MPRDRGIRKSYIDKRIIELIKELKIELELELEWELQKESLEVNASWNCNSLSISEVN